MSSSARSSGVRSSSSRGARPAWASAGTTTFDVGEDYATLAQAFLYAGAGSVVSTLWRIEDEGAAAMASLFYGELARGVGPAEALARAQRTMITEGQYGSPHHWAAYQLTDTTYRGGRRERPLTERE